MVNMYRSHTHKRDFFTRESLTATEWLSIKVSVLNMHKDTKDGGQWNDGYDLWGLSRAKNLLHIAYLTNNIIQMVFM